LLHAITKQCLLLTFTLACHWLKFLPSAEKICAELFLPFWPFLGEMTSFCWEAGKIAENSAKFAEIVCA
jgi:hypothetical protein